MFNTCELFGERDFEFGQWYKVAAIHPECDLIFLVAEYDHDNTLMQYNMDHRKLHVICKVEPISI